MAKKVVNEPKCYTKMCNATKYRMKHSGGDSDALKWLGHFFYPKFYKSADPKILYTSSSFIFNDKVLKMGEEKCNKCVNKIKVLKGLQWIKNNNTKALLKVNVTKNGVEIVKPNNFNLIVVEENGKAYNLFEGCDENER